jgi:FAD:protein FMN transferase
MIRKPSLAITLLIAILAVGVQAAWEDHPGMERRVLKLMGSRFEIIAVSEDSSLSEAAVDAAVEEIERIERLISSWDDSSQTTEINRNAGIQSVRVDEEVYRLIERAIRVSKLTEGAFDITFASMEKVWVFDGTMTKAPSAEAIANSVHLVGHQKILLDENTMSVFLPERGMRIGFGGIGKGYAANRARMVMKELGIENGIVNASGDLTAWGIQPDGLPWGISIADPENPQNELAVLRTNDGAIVTSGDYEKFALIDGDRYAHIIDPRTGWPARGLKSVTILCPDAELADALATAVFVLGEVDGLELINRLKNIECLLMTDDNRIVQSDHVELEYEEDKRETR